MSKNWTQKQKQAIEARGKTLLISAAAGSGKTATLTERIVRRLTDKNDPSSISKMLIVTFTRLSAADLKRKISNAISDELAKDPTNQYLSKQLILLESAHICTIDSFYLDIVRANFQRLSLPSSFRLADEAEMALLRKEVMDDIIEGHYDTSDEGDEGFLAFVENFTSAKQSDTLSDIFLSLHERLCSKTEGTSRILKLSEDLMRESEGDFFQSHQGKILKNYLLRAAESYAEALQKCCDMLSANEKACEMYLPSFSSEKNFFSELSEILKKDNYSLARKHVLSFNKLKLGLLRKEYQTEETALCRAIREEETKFIKTVTERYFSFDEREISSSMKKTGEILLSLYRILNEFEEASLREKIKRKAFEFDDIRRFAYKLLSDESGEPSDIALAYREQFDEIYIDEYQDVDAMQDRIFSLISRENNRFMVGDIKQSIYSFRGADTDVFAGYKSKFPVFEDSEDSDNALIFMSNNFRCDENIIKFTNKVFSFLFGHCGKSIGYTADDDLIFSKAEEGRTLPSPKVHINIITGDESANEDDSPEDESKTDINPEALWIAKEIDRLIKNEIKADGTPIEPRDVAILMRSTTPASDISRALALCKIPCSDNSKYDLFETPDVLLTLSLLSCIDNPHKDIPLAASLYSPIFAYTMDELIEIRHTSSPECSLFEALRNYGGENEALIKKNQYFLSKLDHYRERAASLPIDKLLNHVYRDLSLGSLESSNAENLTRLYEMARRFEAGSFKGLNNFISYINELIENKKVPSLSYEDADTNAVRMVTAHKSKGLEFPVVFVCNTQSAFNTADTKPNLLYHPNAGIALRLATVGGMARINTPMREAVALEMINSQIEEEMRILYVALTRARERLYITAHTRSKLEKLKENALLASSFASDFKIKRCGNWLSMVLASIHPLEDGDGYTFSALEKDGVQIEYNKTDYRATPTDGGITVSEEDANELKRRLSFEYPFDHLSRLPAKLSVSKLTPTLLDDMDNDASTLESLDDAKILEIEEFFETRRRATSADKGTATHLFLQFCDFKNAEKNGARAELSRLVERRFIAEQIAALINISQIERFFESDFYKLLKAAKRSYREQRFNILLPAARFTASEGFKNELEGESILVQGVIDLFFETEDGKIILCDYKTDHLTPEELKNKELTIQKMKKRHGEQLGYYALAVERFLGRAPDKILIYSLPFGEALEIQL